MRIVSGFVAFTSAAAYAVLCGAATPPAPRAAPGVALPQQPVQAPTQSGPSATKFWNVILAVDQIMTQVVEAVIAAGGSGNGLDATELVSAITAEIDATVTTVENLPHIQDLVICQQFPVMIAGFQQQNTAAGKALPNQLTGVQIQLLIQRVSIIGASNPRLANDLKVLVGRLPRS